MATAELSRSKSLVVLAVVVGCFAILWPKIFYPMFQNSLAPPQPKEIEPGLCCGVVFESDASVSFLSEICSLVLKHDLAMDLPTLPLEHGGRPPEKIINLCRQELWKKCNVDLNDVIRTDVDGAIDRERKIQGFRAKNVTKCLKNHFDIDENTLLAKKAYSVHPVLYPRHQRPERPAHLHPELNHPALREKGRVIPPRTIDKQAKPGPIPGMRPPLGGAGHMVPSPSGSGMGLLMPLYTIGIVVFFLYTMMRIMFKKTDENSYVEPMIKNYHLDPEHRKYVFAEEYCSGSKGDMSVADYAKIQDRRSRSKTPIDTCSQQEMSIEEMIENVEEASQEKEISNEMATEKLGECCLASGIQESDNDEHSASEADEPSDRKLLLAFAKLKAQKDEEVDQLRRRLEETEKAMERIMAQMGNVSEKLSPSAIAEILNSSPATTCQDKEALVTEEEQVDLRKEKGNQNEKALIEDAQVDQVVSEVADVVVAQEVEAVKDESVSLEEPITAVEESQDEAQVTEEICEVIAEEMAPALEDEFSALVDEKESAAPALEEEFNALMTEAESTAPVAEEEVVASVAEEESTAPVAEEKTVAPVVEVESTTPEGEEESVAPVSDVESTAPPVEELVSLTVQDETVILEEEPVLGVEDEFSVLVAESESITPAVDDEFDALVAEEETVPTIAVEKTIPSIKIVESTPLIETSIVVLKEVFPSLISTPESVTPEVEEEFSALTAGEEAVSEAVDEEFSALVNEVEEIIAAVEESVAPIVEEPIESVVEESSTPAIEELVEEEIVAQQSSVPVVEEIVTPAVEDTVTPVVEEVFTPVEEVAAAPVVEETVVTAVEETVVPAVEEAAAPAVEEAVSLVDGDIVAPVIEEDENAVAQESPASAAKEEPTTPTAEEVVPVVEEQSPAAVEETIAPAPEIYSAPETEERLLPATVQETSQNKPTPVTRCRSLNSEERQMTVMGMEVTVALESGDKMPMPATCTTLLELLPKSKSLEKFESQESEIHSIFLQASLPPETHLVVSEAECRAEAVPIEQLDLDENEYETSPVVLSGKMTLSVIGMDLSADSVTLDEHPLVASAQNSMDDDSTPGKPHKVRFSGQPEEVIFSVADDYLNEEDAFDHESANNMDYEEIDDVNPNNHPALIYRPPSPPVQHVSESDMLDDADGDKEFLTYSELEEAGETDGMIDEMDEDAPFVSQADDSQIIDDLPMEVDGGSEPVDSKDIEHTLDDIVGKIISESIIGSIEKIKGCVQDVIDPLEMDIENQIVATGAFMAPIQRTKSVPSISEEVFKKDREWTEIEHGLQREGDDEEPIEENFYEEFAFRAGEIPQSPLGEQPTISGFVIREDYPEEDIQLTEEDIQRARKEIEEIKKLLADVSSGVVLSRANSSNRKDSLDQSTNGVKDDGANAATDTSKGSSPDMEEYEVITDDDKPQDMTRKHNYDSTTHPPDNLPSPITPTTEATFENIIPTKEIGQNQ